MSEELVQEHYAPSHHHLLRVKIPLSLAEQGHRKEVITTDLEGVVCEDIHTNELIAGDELLMCCKRRLWLKRSC